jgi:hypothetical protein
MTGMDTKLTTLLRHDPRRLGLVTDAPRRPRAEQSLPLPVVAIGSNRSIIICTRGLWSADAVTSCTGLPRSQRHAGGIC